MLLCKLLKFFSCWVRNSTLQRQVGTFHRAHSRRSLLRRFYPCSMNLHVRRWVFWKTESRNLNCLIKNEILLVIPFFIKNRHQPCATVFVNVSAIITDGFVMRIVSSSWSLCHRSVHNLKWCSKFIAPVDVIFASKRLAAETDKRSIWRIWSAVVHFDLAFFHVSTKSISAIAWSLAPVFCAAG